MLDILKPLFLRELDKVRTEITLYRHEAHIWKTSQDIANSGGNLCLHLVGNLKTFIGKELGGLPYIRNREEEFSLKDIPRSQLIVMVDETRDAVDRTLNQLTDDLLGNVYPVIVFKEKMTTGYFLVHLLSHLSYHLGQLNYHRRLLD